MHQHIPVQLIEDALIFKAKKDLNYIPKISWENGLGKTVEWNNFYLNNNPNLHESFYDSKDE